MPLLHLLAVFQSNQNTAYFLEDMNNISVEKFDNKVWHKFFRLGKIEILAQIYRLDGVLSFKLETKRTKKDDKLEIKYLIIQKIRKEGKIKIIFYSRSQKLKKV